MENKKNSEPKTIGASLKTLDVIEALMKLDGAGVSELADHLDMPKPSTYFHLSTLHSKGYVVRKGSKYELSLRFLNHGENVKRSQPLYHVAKPAVNDLAEETGERVYCWVEQHGLNYVLCMAKGKQALNTNVRSGTPTYMHYTAGGKSILAHLSNDRLEEIFDKWGLPGSTENTITQRDELFENLERQKERGYFTAEEEYEIGLAGVGVPIIMGDDVYGSISIEAPMTRVRKLIDQDVQNLLLGASNMIQVNITFSDE